MSKLQLYTNSEFDRLRLVQDPLADQLISELINNPELITLINSWKEIPSKIENSFPKSFQDYFNFYLNQKNIPEVILPKGQDMFNQKGDF